MKRRPGHRAMHPRWCGMCDRPIRVGELIVPKRAGYVHLACASEGRE